MKRGFVIALATLIGFAAGMFASSWMKSHQPLPPPPAGILSEIRDVPLVNSAPPSRFVPAPPVGAPRPEALQQIKADIEAFKKKMDPLKTEFREQLEALLTPAQRERLKAMSERPAPPAPARPTAQAASGKDTRATPPKAPAPSRSRSYDGMDSTITLVLIPFTLARFTEELGLDESQQAAVHQLLTRRRTQFLELVDSTPPPSINVGKVVPVPEPAK